MPTTPECEFDVVSNEGLLAVLRGATGDRPVMLDCRSSHEYGEAHVRGAVNLSVPSIVLRRLAAGKIDLAATVRQRELRQRVCAAYDGHSLFVLYNDLPAAAAAGDGSSVMGVLLRRLAQDGCRVACLRDGFPGFRAAYPEWCDSCGELLDGGGEATAPGGADPPLPLLGLRSLRISAPAPAPGRGGVGLGGGPLGPPAGSARSDGFGSAANSSTDSSDADDRCDSSLGLEDDREFPVEILPYLFLGNAANSEDSQALARHSIQYILNVTPDLPNVFEDVGHIKYMQIPITDHWSQNLASHFPKAIEFIDQARQRQKGVLVHCVAGVSRSVTVTVAYLMYRCSLNLNDAFNLVRARKSNVAPNFHFMEQLHRFERELKLDVSSRSPLALMEQIRQEQALRRKSLAGGAAQGAPGAGAHQKDASRRRGGTRDLLSPPVAGASPDSGIEFDRWGGATPGTGGGTPGGGGPPGGGE